MLCLDVDVDRRVNLAQQQNAVPVVHRVRVRNDGPQAIDALSLVVDLGADLAPRWSRELGTVGPGETLEVRPVDLRLSPERLVAITEREVIRLSLSLRQGEEVLAETSRDLEVLAYNEWGGADSLPELLAAFVQPNHPALERVLASARDLLDAETGDPSLDGYQSRNPGRVRQVVAAVAAALAAKGLTYVTPPASFEKTGQKIRSADQVLDTKMGTCLDLSVLFAACLEQVGLKPLLVLVEGHAFVGAWLIDTHLEQAAIEDGQRLRKRVDLGDLCVFDAVAVASRPPPRFEAAERSARARLDDLDAFLFAIDVASARERRILPLPSRRSLASFEPLEPGDVPATAPSSLPDAGRGRRDERGSEEREREQPRTRVDRWKEQLLDLTLRNRLLAYRETKKHVPLAPHELGQVEDALATGRDLQLWPAHALMGGRDPRDPEVFAARTGEDPRAAFLADELRAGRLRSTLTEAELRKRLVQIFRQSRTSRQEGGANVLYLALGFLAWPERPGSDSIRLAPLLLLPLELVRSRSTDPFVIRRGDEEARINVTLLKKLEVEHGLTVEGINELPEDEAGLDVDHIFRAFRRAVVDLDGAEVREEAVLGLFSFTKFLMWRDLEDRTASLLQSPVVRHLVEGDGAAFAKEDPFLPASRLDEERAPDEVLTVVDADSSQLTAVVAAGEGRSFVLEGPPGTGKSQTITNLIAHCLGQGRTVLFVSEKMAALEVVSSRLAAVGLEPFCLELHSNKTRKADALASLARALEVGAKRRPRQWAARVEELTELRAELNRYADAIHRPRAIGASVREVTARLVDLGPGARVRFELGSPESLTEDRLDAMRDAVERLVAGADAVGSAPARPWKTARLSTWTPRLQREVSRDLEALLGEARRLRAAAGAASAALDLPATDDSEVELRRLDELCALLLASPRPPRALLDGEDWPAGRPAIESVLEHGWRHRALHERLAERWDVAPLLELDLGALRAKLERWGAAFFLFAWLFLLGTRRALRRVWRAAGQPLPPARPLIEALDDALALREEARALDKAAPAVAPRLGELWRGEETDWDAVGRVLRWCGEVRAALDDLLRRATTAPASVRDRAAELATSPPDAETDRRRALRELHDAWVAYADRRRALDETLALDVGATWGAPDEPGHLDRVEARAEALREAITSLRDWCVYRRAADAVEEAGLAALVDEHLTGRIETADLLDVFQRSVLETWLEAVVAGEEVLRDFHGEEHGRKIARFRELDAQLLRMTRKLVVATLARQVPDPAREEALASEMKLLAREIEKKRRHLPIRRLFEAIGPLLPRLKPCLLMSPLSVAQYLDTERPPYDVVVFDEASQIPVWDAIGALARGRAAVVVGDTRQLPPTSFFATVEHDDFSLEDDFEELESILDECVASGLPRHRLLWHYRSRHESLITFSNQHYYDGSLLTFPCAAAGDERLGVSLVPVPEGVYDRRRTRTNRAEAEALVADVIRRLEDPVERQRSLGVVTFSQAQQALVQDLIDRAVQGRPDLERLVADDDAAEPFFVKNLENVQGDERDVILFTICYGPDESGRVAMHFGPLNRRGGERRLNVAVTRAREALVVFSTLRPDQIDLTRTSSEGVRHLQAFLEHAARRGPSTPANGRPLENERHATAIEDAIHDALVERGWTVRREVGASGYKIDLAVVHPDEPSRFLLGVECDGRFYRAAATARDRDRLRALVLERLGWTLHRVWSADWWLDPAREIARLESALAEASR